MKAEEARSIDPVAESSEKDGAEVTPIEGPTMAEPVPVEAPMDLPALPDIPALSVVRTELHESPTEVGGLDIWLALLVNLCHTRHGRADVLVSCSPILAALLEIMPSFINNDMGDYSRSVHTLHGIDFVYRIAAIREAGLCQRIARLLR